MKYIYLTAMLAFSSLIEAAIRPADGLWVTSDDPAIGSGLMLTTQNDITLISIFTYDQDGENAWYITSGQVNDEGIFEAPLLETQDGENVVIDNPESASFTGNERTLRLRFTGTQAASMSIDGSELKNISPLHFNYAAPNGFPEISGQWLVANAESEQSVVLDLVADEPTVSDTSPISVIEYSSTHPSSEDWEIFCLVGFSPDQVCFFQPDSSSDIPELQVLDIDIGNQRTELKSLDGNTTYEAFRINPGRSFLPNDGHWIPADDPAIGSGLVMRTQGEDTIALLYTYNDSGEPIWQIASGSFDENGRLTADLNTPTNGTAIESDSPMTAVWELPQTIDIQLQGLELATLSIDGSTPKAIQNTSFGANLFKTDHFLVDNEPYWFPEQSGSWAVAFSNSENINPAVLDLILNNGGTITPVQPGSPLFYSSSFQAENNPINFSVDFICLRAVVNNDVNPTCNGDYISEGVGLESSVYFEDIGFDRFRLYIGTESVVSRESTYIDFYRLED